MRGLFVAIVIAWPLSSMACTMDFGEREVVFDPALSVPDEASPAAPAIISVDIWSVVERRWTDPKTGAQWTNGCSFGPLVSFVIAVTDDTKDIAYTFEVVTGEEAGRRFGSGPMKGRVKAGEMTVTLPWDVPGWKLPIEMDVVVTPYTPSGLAGTPTTVKVSDPGNRRAPQR